MQLSCSISLLISICSIFIKYSASQPSPAHSCVLNFQVNGTFETSRSGNGNWGGFIDKNCSNGSFKDYVYMLGICANQTGKIFLNKTEQRACFPRGNDYLNSDCEFKKLRSGNGGCSDYSVDDVRLKMGSEMRSLMENCGFYESLNGEENRSCNSCVKSWKKIRAFHKSRITIPAENESDLCRFAVLISLTSLRFEDLYWVRKIYSCLEDQDISQGLEAERDVEKTTSRSEKLNYAKIGGIIGAAAVVMIFIYLSIKERWKQDLLPAKRIELNCIVPEEYNLPKLSIEAIYAATNNLNKSNCIGEGTSGKVYKGVLLNKRKVAVKHFVNDKYAKTFLREISCLSQVIHPNLVALIGFCENENEKFLIYELCPNGSLSEWLLGKDKILSWIQRLEIALDSAQGLRFLHTYPGRCIVHRDIKPTNILLGTNFRAKLSDFGLSKVVDVDESSFASEIRGTFGYQDPEYQSDRAINSSGDVYSFGIMLLQIISGKNVVDMNLKSPEPLHKTARTLSKCGSILQFADPKLDGEFSSEAFDMIFDLALSCTTCKQERASMDQVVVILEKALYISINAKASTPYSSRSSTPYSSRDSTPYSSRT